MKEEIARHLVDDFVRTIDRSMWRHIYRGAFSQAKYDEEHNLMIAGPIQYSFMPDCSNSIVSLNDRWTKPAKYAAIYNWYKTGDTRNYEITHFFDEYKRCIDHTHMYFNSNYGVYMYAKGLLDACYNTLKQNKDSRRACAVINDREIAMHPAEIDQLCTNTIHYFINGKYLQCVVQMRSSNMATLLPYDAFMFSVFMAELWQKLHSDCYPWLEIGSIYMQVANAHLTVDDLPKYSDDTPVVIRHSHDLAKLSVEINTMCTNDTYEPKIQLFNNKY